jgi:hypothetical protein
LSENILAEKSCPAKEMRGVTACFQCAWNLLNILKNKGEE